MTSTVPRTPLFGPFSYMWVPYRSKLLSNFLFFKFPKRLLGMIFPYMFFFVSLITWIFWFPSYSTLTDFCLCHLIALNQNENWKKIPQFNGHTKQKLFHNWNLISVKWKLPTGSKIVINDDEAEKNIFKYHWDNPLHVTTIN